MAIVGDDQQSHNPLVDSGTDIRNQYSAEKMLTSTVAGVASLLNPVLLPVGVATGQFSNTEDFDGLNDGTIVDSVQQLCEQISGGDWPSAVMSGAGLAVDVTGAVLDPMSFLSGQVVGWMLEHVEPLRALLHQLTGNPAMVEGYANTWRNIAQRMAEQAKEHAERLGAGTADWKGAASDAYRRHAVELIGRAAGGAFSAAGLAEAAAKMKDVVDTVRGGVRDILADLVGTLVSCTIEVLTGVGAPDAVRRALLQIGKAMLKAEDLLMKLGLVVAKLGALLTDLQQLQDQLDAGR
ncbi:hypothetical protein [Actinosynnema sp. NPDC020468]|uniref:hypothetical protein n=1 Tax=Actinosynnema sp. NPDC020468 TaxID=3154488 RepID=UPI00340809E4